MKTGLHHELKRRSLEEPYARLLDLAVTTSFLRLDPGKWKTPGIVVVFKDITEFKALDRARQRVLDHLSHQVEGLIL